MSVQHATLAEKKTNKEPTTQHNNTLPCRHQCCLKFVQNLSLHFYRATFDAGVVYINCGPVSVRLSFTSWEFYRNG